MVIEPDLADSPDLLRSVHHLFQYIAVSPAPLLRVMRMYADRAEDIRIFLGNLDARECLGNTVGDRNHSLNTRLFRTIHDLIKVMSELFIGQVTVRIDHRSTEYTQRPAVSYDGMSPICYHTLMHSLTRDELATLDVRDDDRAMLAREFDRQGWITVCAICDHAVQSVRRYKPSYFHHLCQEGRLPMGEEQQVVIGLD